MDLNLHSVIRGAKFDSVVARLGISLRDLDDLVAPIEAVIAADPEAFPTEPGTPYRVAPLRLPNGMRIGVRYQVGMPYRPGEIRCVLDHVVVPDRLPAS